MLRLILLVLLVVFIARSFWRIVDGIIEGASGQRPSSRAPTSGVPMARDPVCGTFVLPDRAVTLADGRQRLYFCSTACRDRYRARTA